jgi:beta-1,4-mannosyl-glycoprotein beta-1,4-N-acetylglucosaminyltransferase
MRLTSGFRRFFLCLLLLISSISSCSKTQKVKIYDCFIFYNEIELLKCRLAELYDHVDCFVLVESVETFQGKEKPLIFQENKHLFSQYLDKIRHVVVKTRSKTENPWRREQIQRDAILKGLYDAKPEDIVLVSDADEIVRASKLPEIMERLELSTDFFLKLEMSMSRFFINRVDGYWSDPYAIQYKAFSKIKTSCKRPDALRHRHQLCVTPTNTVREAGWHFSSLGGHAQYLLKIESYSHAEDNTPEKKTWDHYVRSVKESKRVDIDDSFPQYVCNHQEEFIRLGYVDDGQYTWLNE